jgi:predicted MPP superfamily phosphohydrolase
MKDMAIEAYATVMSIIACWIVILVLDVAVCGVVSIVAGAGFKKSFLWGLLALALPPMFMLYGALVGRNLFEVKEVEIPCYGLPENFDGYRIVHISDIHARSFAGRHEQLEKAADIINSLSPDMIAFTGDLITLSPDELDTTAPILGNLKAVDGVISVLGNHDYSIYGNESPETREVHLNNLIERERAMGWNLLINKNIIVSRGTDSIAIIGVENTSPSKHFPSRGELIKASEGTEGMFRILLTHDPMHWEAEILGKDYPLTLSGHTHAMQMSLLGWTPSSLMFRQSRGIYSEGSQHLYVNIGLGETILPVRIGARPEITLITLRKQ